MERIRLSLLALVLLSTQSSCGLLNYSAGQLRQISTSLLRVEAGDDEAMPAAEADPTGKTEDLPTA